MRNVFGTLLVFLLISKTTFAEERMQTVERFIEAFNQRDVDKMLELSMADLRWMSISGEQIAIEVSNHAELRESMLAYFESTPSASSKISSITESGAFVYTLEEASWSTGGVEKSQCSFAMYEFAGEKILHVWYFPEHPCTAE